MKPAMNGELWHMPVSSGAVSCHRACWPAGHSGMLRHHPWRFHMAVSTSAPALLAQPEYRVEGPLKVTGRARYSADVLKQDMLTAKFLLSPHAHARIVSIDTAAAKAVPGVHAVLTGQDIGPKLFGRVLYDWPVLAYERVLYPGERVAAVAAETREAAEEAVARIEVEYEELPGIFDGEEALRDGAPILHPDGDD